MRPAWLMPLIALVETSACAAGSPSQPTAPPTISPPVRTASSEPPASPQTTEVEWLPLGERGESFAHMTVRTRESDGALNVTRGELRMTIRDGHVTFANEMPRHWIDAAIPVTDGWIFHSTRGEMWWSGTFLGPLRDLPPTDMMNSPSCVRGRFVLLDRAGAAWTQTRAGSPLERISLPIDDATQLQFVDADRGVLLARSGAVFTTLDGGTHWTPQTAARPLSPRLVWSGASLRIESSAAPARVPPPGFETVPRNVCDESIEPAVRDAFDTAILRDHVAWLRALGRPFVPLRGGSGVVDRGHGHALVVRDGADPREVTGLDDSCGRRPFARWGGDALLAVCAPRAYRIEGHEAIPLHSMLGRVWASNDGDHLLTATPCPSRDGTTSSRPAGVGCWWSYRSRTGRDVRVPDADDLSLLGANLYAIESDHLTRFTLSESAPRTERLELPRAPDGTPIVLAERRPGWRVSLTDDGLVAAISERHADNRTFAVLGPPDALRVVSLPSDALDAGFTDASHGVAAGVSFEQIWVTNDGGRSWQHVPLGEGSIDIGTRFWVPIECAAGACAVNGEVAIRSFGGGPAHWNGIAPHTRSEPSSSRIVEGEGGAR